MSIVIRAFVLAAALGSGGAWATDEWTSPSQSAPLPDFVTKRTAVVCAVDSATCQPPQACGMGSDG